MWKHPPHGTPAPVTRPGLPGRGQRSWSWSTLPKKVIGMRGMRITGQRTAPLARRLGLDRNPLRRRSDRAEAWIRIALVLAFLIGAPLAFLGAERWADSVAPTVGHAQRAGEHRVPATLLQGVPGGSDSFAVVTLGWVRARWIVPGGPARTGYVEA